MIAVIDWSFELEGAAWLAVSILGHLVMGVAFLGACAGAWKRGPLPPRSGSSYFSGSDPL